MFHPRRIPRKVILPKRVFFWCLLFALWGCAWAPGFAEEIRVTDFRGKEVRIKQPARRIVCLIESALTGLYMLGVENSVVGISTNIYQGNVYPYYAAMDERIRLKKLPTPGNWDFVNIESVLALKPDLIIIWSKQSESISVLEERGVPVYGVFLNRKEDVYEEIKALGKLTGKEERADQIISYSKEELSRLGGRVQKIQPGKWPRVYYMWAQGPLETSCGGSIVDNLISLSGGRNVCGAIDQEHSVVNLEKVLSWNPEVIVMWYNERKDPADLLKDPQWRTVKAVRDGRVHEFPEVFLCDLWTLKFQYAMKMVAKWCHPSLFGDLDLGKDKIRMLEYLYGPKIKGARIR
jgi:iron complex transport system substrate-binding protein